MKEKNFSQLRAALVVARESENILFRLRVSICSDSSGNGFLGFGLESYLRTTRRTLFVRWIVTRFLRGVSGLILSIISRLM